MNGIVGIIQAKFWIEFDVVSKQSCLFASILCGADLLFKQYEHRLWFTLELDHCGTNPQSSNPYVPETLADRLKTDGIKAPTSAAEAAAATHSATNPATLPGNRGKSRKEAGKSSASNKQHVSKVSECRGYSVWPVWDETICVAPLNDCANKSLWLKLYDDDLFLGQLYLDASEIDVDNVIRWYELDPGFER